MQFIRYYIFLVLAIYAYYHVNAADRNIDYQNIIFEKIKNNEEDVSLSVINILQDKQGFMWFSSADGLYRYNAYTFDVFQYNPEDTNSISSNYIKCFMEDDEGKIWVGTNYGLNIFDKNSGNFKRYFYDSANQNSLWYNSINDVFQCKNGNIWIATVKGLNRYDMKKKWMSRVNIDQIMQKDEENHWLKDEVIAWQFFHEDQQHNLWISTWNHGLIKLNYAKKELKQFDVHQNKNLNRVTTIVEDNHGMLHLGTYEGHHLLFDPVAEKIVDTIYSGMQMRASMVDNAGNIWTSGIDELSIYSGKDYSRIAHYTAGSNKADMFNKGSMIDDILQDNMGNVWLSTRREILVHFLHKNNFNKYYHEIGNSKYRDYGKVFFIDNQQNFWYGTYGDGLLLFDKNFRLINRFKNIPGKTSLPANFIWTITQGEKDNIWVGTSEGIAIFDPYKKKIIKTLQNTKEKKNILSHNAIYEILHDSRGNVWIETEKGIDILKPDGSIIDFTEQENVVKYQVNTLVEDAKGNIWIGTNYGLVCYNPENKSHKSYVYDPQTNSGLSNQHVNALFFDSAGDVWIGTDYGLDRLHPEENTTEYFFKEDGLTDNRINQIKPDIKGNLWMLSPGGLSKMNLKTKKITTFDKNDGLLINYSGLYVNDSILYLGGKNTGFYSFSIHDLKFNPIPPPVYITQIKVNNEILNDRYIERSKEKINFKYHQSSIEFTFTALNYLSPGKNQFKFMLEGFGEQWNLTTGNRRMAVYNNLPPGNYTFKVKASNNNGIWNPTPVIVSFKISHPWWGSWWAFILYLMIFTGLIILLIRIRNVQKDQEKAKFQHEQDEMKLNFFTNISHEYKSPLTLIIDPLEQMMSSSNIPESMSKQLEIAYGNAKRMKHLTEQILDLRKIEAGKVKSCYQYDDIIPFIKNIYHSFYFVSHSKAIQYTFNSPYETFSCYFDAYKLETILFNLLSNAFKYTEKSGKINIEFDSIKQEKSSQHINDKEQSKSFNYFKVSNTGEKISKNEIEKIFDRYYQTEQFTEKDYKGTGIGLALTKELVTVLNGTIRVEDDTEYTNFIVSIPIPENVELNPDHYVEKETRQNEYVPIEQENNIIEHDDEFNIKHVTDKMIMLIAEDDDEMRSFIATIFKNDFEVIQAKNGREGAQKAYEYLPDVIISDIMMKGGDGLSFCNTIKNDEKTNHIPFILLTAKTADHSKLEGYTSGADDYVMKPFNSALLKARISTLLKNRATLQEYLKKRYVFDEGLKDGDQIEGQSESYNENFIKKVKDDIYVNMHQEEYSVTELSKNIQMSRTHLTRKLKAILGISASEFIKLCRLKKAMQLLKNSPDKTISEVAYVVGFKEVTSFSRAFKNHYGFPPSNLKKM